MTDLTTVDPATVKADVELDALIAEKWMGWTSDGLFWRTDQDVREKTDWSPSTSLAHSGEALMEANSSNVHHYIGGPVVVEILTTDHWVDVFHYRGQCEYHETNGNKGEAQALATCRAITAAIVTAMIAAEEESNGCESS